MMRSSLSLSEVGQANIGFAYLKGVYARDVGGVLRKIAVLNSSSILDIGEDTAGLEVPTTVHGTTSTGLRVTSGDAAKVIGLFHNGSIGYLSCGAGLVLECGGVSLFKVGGDTGGSTSSVRIGAENLFFPIQAATGGKTYRVGSVWFNTTLNKLQVGGAAGIETITSV